MLIPRPASFAVLLLLASASLAQQAPGSDLGFGPLFAKFMQENRDFGELVRGERYPEALDLLNRRAATPEIRLARSYILLALGRVADAWEEAQAYDGPEPYEILHHVGLAARDRASAEPDEEVRAGIIEVGLQAATRALAARKDDAGTMEVKSQLLRQKAKLTLDPGEENALLEEAYALWKQATELRPPGTLPEKMAGGGPPYRIGGNVTRPEKIAGAPPQYTLEARKARVTGVVILEAVIDEQGNVTDVRVLKGLPDGLDQAAVEAVRTWKFSPAKMDGKPVPVWYTLTVKFTIEEEKEPDVPRASP